MIVKTLTVQAQRTRNVSANEETDGLNERSKIFILDTSETWSSNVLLSFLIS